jgi:hypothetical protein
MLIKLKKYKQIIINQRSIYKGRNFDPLYKHKKLELQNNSLSNSDNVTITLFNNMLTNLNASIISLVKKPQAILKKKHNKEVNKNVNYKGKLPVELEKKHNKEVNKNVNYKGKLPVELEKKHNKEVNPNPNYKGNNYDPFYHLRPKPW